MEEIIRQLISCRDRQEATELLASFKKTDLAELAEELFIPKKLNKPELMDRIIQSTIGWKMHSA